MELTKSKIKELQAKIDKASKKSVESHVRKLSKNG